MAQSVRAPIEGRSRRLRLEARKEPYWCTIERGLAVGYHRPVSGAGTWWARVLVSPKPTRYRSAALAHADDHTDADDDAVLDWKQAQAAARRWAAKQNAAGPLTVRKAIERYIADLKARKGGTAAKLTEDRLNKHAIPVLGDVLVSELMAGQVRSWLNGLIRGDDDEHRRRSMDSANRVLAVFKAALNLAFQDGLVTDDRAWRRVQAFKGVGEARKVILSNEEINRLIDACPAGPHELVAAGAMTGCRLGELTGARVRDLDPAAATLKVAGKTGGREVHLAPLELRLLRRLAAGKRPQDHLFLTAAGEPWSEGRHKRPFAAAVAKAGLDPEATFYSLRHASVTRMLKAGVPTQAVAEHHGTSARMIEANYAKFVPSDRAKYAAMVPELRLGPDDGKVVPLRSGGAGR
jgi:integrase